MRRIPTVLSIDATPRNIDEVGTRATTTRVAGERAERLKARVVAPRAARAPRR